MKIMREDKERRKMECASKMRMLDKQKRKEEAEARRTKEQEKYRLHQTNFQKKKRNVKSLAGTKKNLAEVQTTDKARKEELAKLSERVENVVEKNKAIKDQKVDSLEVMKEEFTQEIENMSPLEPRLSSEE